MRSKLFLLHIHGSSMSSSSKRQFGGTLVVVLVLGAENWDQGLWSCGGLPFWLGGCDVNSDDLGMLDCDINIVVCELGTHLSGWIFISDVNTPNS